MENDRPKYFGRPNVIDVENVDFVSPFADKDMLYQSMIFCCLPSRLGAFSKEY